MAQRAFAIAIPNSLASNGENADNIDIDFLVCIKGGDHGTLPTGLPTIHFGGINPNTTKVVLEEMIKTELLAGNVPFGIGDTDTVRIF